MSMKIDAELIIRLRKERSWSQEELAIASGLNLRTIQRIEREALASLQSKKAVAAALEVDTQDLESEEGHMKRADEAQEKPCPVCGSDEIFQYKKDFADPGGTGETLLPGLGSNVLFVAKIRTTVCHSCGHVQIFAADDARRNLKTSKHWKPIGA
jgi:transcriptional regulator with XRE-family HTH domain